MSRAPLFLVLLLAIPLTGCGKSKFQELGECRLMALKETKGVSDPDAAYSKEGDYTMLCMQSKGYDVDWQRGGCSSLENSSYTVAKEDCYYRRWF